MDELSALADAQQWHGDGPVVGVFIHGQATDERVEVAESAGERGHEVVDEFGWSATAVGLGQEYALLDVVEAQHPEVLGRQVDGPQHRRRDRRWIGVNPTTRREM